MCHVPCRLVWWLYCCVVVSSVCLLCRLWVHALLVAVLTRSVANPPGIDRPEGGRFWCFQVRKDQQRLLSSTVTAKKLYLYSSHRHIELYGLTIHDSAQSFRQCSCRSPAARSTLPRTHRSHLRRSTEAVSSRPQQNTITQLHSRSKIECH